MVSDTILARTGSGVPLGISGSIRYFGRSSTLCIATGSTPFSSTPVAVRLPCVTIIGLMMNGATPMTPFAVAAFFITSRYSLKSMEYLRTRTCALTPSTFSRNCSSKPPVTLRTMASPATPSVTPRMAKAVLTETNVRFFDPR